MLQDETFSNCALSSLVGYVLHVLLRPRDLLALPAPQDEHLAGDVSRLPPALSLLDTLKVMG